MYYKANETKKMGKETSKDILEKFAFGRSEAKLEAKPVAIRRIGKSVKVNTDNKTSLGGGRMKKKITKILVALVVVVIVALIGTTYYFYNKYKRVSVSEVNEIAGKVGKLMELPGEAPTLGTVTDKDKLKDQPFFANSQNGDKVLIYPLAGKAILYRPSINKIIEVTYLTIGNQSNSNQASQINTLQSQQRTTDNAGKANTDQASQQPSQTTEPANVAIYNGTDVKGIAANVADKIASLDGLTVVQKTNATGSYANTTIVNLNGKDQAAQKIADTLEAGQVSTDLPNGEKKPDADILIIVGKDFSK